MFGEPDAELWPHPRYFIEDEEEATISHYVGDFPDIPPQKNLGMVFFVKTMFGETHTLDVSSDRVTVCACKRAIWRKTGTPVDSQRLIYAGCPLEDGRSLRDCNISKECTVHVALRLLGC